MSDERFGVWLVTEGWKKNADGTDWVGTEDEATRVSISTTVPGPTFVDSFPRPYRLQPARVTAGWDGDDAVGRAYMGQHRSAVVPRTRAERVEVMRRRLADMVIPNGPGVRVSTLDVSVYRTRYGGAYEHGDSYEDIVWFAWIGDVEWLDDAWAGDNACSAFWADYRDAPVGRGDTPDDAVADIVRQAKEANSDGQ